MSETVEIFVVMEKGRVEGLVLPKTTKLSELLIILKTEKGAHEEVILFEDDDDVVNLEEEIHVRGRRRLVCHRHHSVHVTVQYNGEKVEKSFQPSKTIKRIQEWAVDGFHLDKVGKWGLHRDGIDGTLVDEKVHIGSLVHFPEDKITLYLAETHKIHG